MLIMCESFYDIGAGSEPKDSLNYGQICNKNPSIDREHNTFG